MRSPQTGATGGALLLLSAGLGAAFLQQPVRPVVPCRGTGGLESPLFKSSWRPQQHEEPRVPRARVVCWPHSKKTAHDEITYRRRGEKGEVLSSIPQAERYSSQDWIHNIINIPGSQVLSRIKNVIFCNSVWTFIVVWLSKRLGLSPLPSGAHSLLASALFLLLVFRTNSSYARYWEGRKIWQRILDKSRDLARMITLYEDAMGFTKMVDMAKLMCAFPMVLREHLTGVGHKPELLRLLGTHQVEQLECSWHRPMYIVNSLARIVRSIPDGPTFTSRERLAMLALLNDFSSCVGACERIVQTPVPLSYARHTSRFLTLWLWTLPWVLVADLGYLLVVIMAFMTWGLFGILEIGLLIEEPFGKVLRLEVITNTIMEDVTLTVQENRLGYPKRVPMPVTSVPVESDST